MVPQIASLELVGIISNGNKNSLKLNNTLAIFSAFDFFIGLQS